MKEENHLPDPYMHCKNMTDAVIVTKMYFTFMFTLILDFLDELTNMKWMWSSFYMLENAFFIPILPLFTFMPWIIFYLLTRAKYSNALPV